MRKIINRPEDFVDEVLSGIYAAHGESLRPATSDGRALARADAPAAGRVSIVTGGGSGHLPLFLGYVGPGLCSAAAVGNVFSSPSARQIFEAAKATEGGAGVLFLYGNYGGDVYNFDLAADLLEAEGISTETVLGADDILSAPSEKAETRRGVAGLVLLYKAAGAAAETGVPLSEVARIARKAGERTRTMGVGLAPTILPAAGEPTFQLGESEMEIGIGIHGEQGAHRGGLEHADAITDRFIAELEKELTLRSGSRVAVLVNGLGATPAEELYLIHRRLAEVLGERGVTIGHRYIGEYVTSLEMAGASVSIMVLDEELNRLLAAPARSPFYRPGSHGETCSWSRSAVQEDSGPEVTRTGRQNRLRALLLEALPRWEDHAEELRRLDAEVGDGDLGVTISAGSRAVCQMLRAVPEDISDRDVLLESARTFAEANPATFSALTAAGLIAAAEALREGRPAEEQGWGMLRAFTGRVQERGGAQLGDKTFLDVLLPLEELPPQAGMEEVAARAQELLEASDLRRNRRGRAAWLGERTEGRRDPGSAAAVHLLRELAAAWRSGGSATR